MSLPRVPVTPISPICEAYRSIGTTDPIAFVCVFNKLRPR